MATHDRQVMMAARDDLMEELAEKVGTEALASDNLQFRLDAFKALSSYHIGMTRAKKGLVEEKPEGPTMEDLIGSIRKAERADA